MKRVLTLLLVLVLFKISYSQDYQDWKFMHPRPHSSSISRIKMIDANTWLAVGSTGLFMKTTNAGQNWYFNYTAGKIGNAGAVTGAKDLWFFNANTGLVVGDQGYVGRTTNGGVTFDSLALGLVPTNSRCWAIWFADASTGYIGAGSQTAFTTQILKTTNGGLNWTTVYTNSSLYISALGGADVNTVLAPSMDGTLLRTSNGGNNWSVTPAAVPQGMYNVSFLNSTTGFLCGYNGYVRRTTDAGLSFDTINTPQTDWSLFQVKTVSASEIYAMGDPQYIYKSTNLGNSWTSMPLIVTGPALTYIWYSLDKIGSNIVVSGDYGIVGQSVNNGITFSSKSYELSTSFMFDMQTIPGTSKVFCVGRPVSGTLQGQVFYSSNSGNNWTLYNLDTVGDFSAISMINENTGFVSGQNSKIKKTTNGGQTWFTMNPPSANSYNLYNMKFFDVNTGFVFVNYDFSSIGKVFKTTDGCQTWQQYSHGTSDGINSADMLNANTGFITLNSSGRQLYKTTNGGVNWAVDSTGLTGTIGDVRFADANTVYAGSSYGTSRIARSTNGGNNWTLLTLPAACDVKSIKFKDANTGYVCGNLTTAVFRTTNGGQSWTFQNLHNVTLGKVYVNNSDTAWALGGNCAIFRYTGSTATGVEYSGNVTPKDYELKQNYPNPFNPVTTIEFNLPKAGNVSVKVYDITGRQYNTEIRNMQLNAGNFKLYFNASELSSGVYFYSLVVNGEQVASKKMLLVK